MTKVLDGKVALVTGASRGLGAVFAAELAAAGASVIVNYHASEGDAAALVERIRRDGGKAWMLQADVSDEKQVERLAREAFSCAERVDVLVNNAGVNRDGVSWRLSKEDWDAVRRVNFDAPFLCTKAFLPGMRERRWGRIINVSSVVGEACIAGTSAYAATKAAVLGFTRAVAAEVAKSGVTVNALTLGYFDTGLLHRIPQDIRDKLVTKIPVERFGDPKEAAAALVFLASPAGAYLTGQAIGVNGGFRP